MRYYTTIFFLAGQSTLVLFATAPAMILLSAPWILVVVLNLLLNARSAITRIQTECAPPTSMDDLESIIKIKKFVITLMVMQDAARTTVLEHMSALRVRVIMPNLRAL